MIDNEEAVEESAFDQEYVPPTPAEANIPDDFEFTVQTITVESFYHTFLYIDDPKKRGIVSITSRDVVVCKIGFDGEIEKVNENKRNQTRMYLLSPNTPELDGYTLLPFYDVNGNEAVKTGDVLEVIQDDFRMKSKTDRAAYTGNNEIYFRIIRNITRPEVDYSAVWQ
ncbi:MAG: hypothetical protein F4166_02205 [Gammaproteobacteria bacterium]|nr:hypothetical protein [Gammaproteobacteria bacterium]